jgi:hypothetical protein
MRHVCADAEWPHDATAIAAKAMKRSDMWVRKCDIYIFQLPIQTMFITVKPDFLRCKITAEYAYMQ